MFRECRKNLLLTITHNRNKTLGHTRACLVETLRHPQKGSPLGRLITVTQSRHEVKIRTENPAPTGPGKPELSQLSKVTGRRTEGEKPPPPNVY